MSLPLAFWDSSALVPLCAAQPQTNSAWALHLKYQVVTWWATEVEIRSALTRLKRRGDITSGQFVIAKKIAQELAQVWLSIHESASVTRDACSLLETHPLSAADALQLAAALETCQHTPRGFVFVSGDLRQTEAAREIGFTVEFV
jgi:predicted nucleic acid-binding protein